MSTISKHPPDVRRLSATLDPALRRALGCEIRRRRLARALSQGQLGAPLSRAYVCAVESGRTVPSLPALQHLATRLGIALSELIRAAEDAASNPT